MNVNDDREQKMRARAAARLFLKIIKPVLYPLLLGVIALLIRCLGCRYIRRCYHQRRIEEQHTLEHPLADGSSNNRT